jgi:hypothetical protein
LKRWGWSLIVFKAMELLSSLSGGSGKGGAVSVAVADGDSLILW